jgi:hypothetical protein
MPIDFNAQKKAYTKDVSIYMTYLMNRREKDPPEIWKSSDFIENMITVMKGIEREIFVRFHITKIVGDEIKKIGNKKGSYHASKRKGWELALIYNACKLLESDDFYDYIKEKNVNIKDYIPLIDRTYLSGMGE